MGTVSHCCCQTVSICSLCSSVFRDRVSEASDSLGSIATRMLSGFHEAPVAQAGSEYPTVIDMEPQVATYIARVEDAMAAFQSSIKAKQKEISRLPVGEIQEAMLPTYKACSNRRGEHYLQ